MHLYILSHWCKPLAPLELMRYQSPRAVSYTITKNNFKTLVLVLFVNLGVNSVISRVFLHPHGCFYRNVRVLLERELLAKSLW